MAELEVPVDPVLYPSLGGHVAKFIQERFTFGPGSMAGESARIDEEKLYYLWRMYEIYPCEHHLAGQRRFNRVALEMRKGVGKTSFAAWIVAAELHPESPVRFNGWNDDGTPAWGRPVNSPYIPMLADSKGQADELCYAFVKFILENSDDTDLFDIGMERIVRLGPIGEDDGRAVAVSGAPGSRDGALTTFQHIDEAHRLYLPRIRAAHETMLQNLPKRPQEQPWTLYTSTAGQPGQNSIEEDLRLEAEEIHEGKRESDPTFYYFARWAGPEHTDLTTVEKRIAAVAEATGDVGEWAPGQFERIARDYTRKGVDRAYWERVWLNRWHQGESQAFPLPRVRKLSEKGIIPNGAFVALGFDGARRRDSTALVATDIETGLQELIGLWEKPDIDDIDWSVPEDEVTQTIADAMERYEVWRIYCDPPYWIETVAGWAQRWPKQIIEWHTNRHRRMAFETRAYVEAIDSGAIRFAGGAMYEDFIKHLGHTAKKELRIKDDNGQPLWVPCKPDGRDEDKIDASVAAILSWSAVLDARRSGAEKPEPLSMLFRIR